MSTAFELRVKKYFESGGYTVFRSAGSHRVAVLIAFSEYGRPMLIQCKAVGTMSKEESNKLYRVAIQNHTVPVFVSKNKKGRLNIEIIKEMK